MSWPCFAPIYFLCICCFCADAVLPSTVLRRSAIARPGAQRFSSLPKPTTTTPGMMRIHATCSCSVRRRVWPSSKTGRVRSACSITPWTQTEAFIGTGLKPSSLITKWVVRSASLRCGEFVYILRVRDRSWFTVRWFVTTGREAGCTRTRQSYCSCDWDTGNGDAVQCADDNPNSTPAEAKTATESFCVHAKMVRQ